MQPHQRDFLDLATRLAVLRFGEFTLKSGRVSPYFFNAGLFNTGAALAALGQAYAAAAEASGVGYDMLFGPAYKGISLATTMAVALNERHGRDVPVAFNRKEAKDHGEAGILIGAPLSGRVLIVDDVITAGTSVRESVALIRAHGAEPAGVLIALDRAERGQGELSAADEVRRSYGLPVASIVTVDHVLAYAKARAEFNAFAPGIAAYRAQYGVAAG